MKTLLISTSRGQFNPLTGKIECKHCEAAAALHQEGAVNGLNFDRQAERDGEAIRHHDENIDLFRNSFEHVLRQGGLKKGLNEMRQAGESNSEGGPSIGIAPDGSLSKIDYVGGAAVGGQGQPGILVPDIARTRMEELAESCGHEWLMIDRIADPGAPTTYQDVTENDYKGFQSLGSCFRFPGCPEGYVFGLRPSQQPGCVDLVMGNGQQAWTYSFSTASRVMEVGPGALKALDMEMGNYGRNAGRIEFPAFQKIRSDLMRMK